jgi:CspA family cold shock protein
MTVGSVTFFDAAKGFGFVYSDDDAKEVFVAMSAVEAAGMPSLRERQRLSFHIKADGRGSKAIDLKAA